VQLQARVQASNTQTHKGKKMNTERLVRKSFKTIFDHARDRVITNIAEASTKGRVTINSRDLAVITSLIDASFSQALTQTDNQINKLSIELDKK